MQLDDPVTVSRLKSYTYSSSMNTIDSPIRAFEDEAKARLGVVECAKHELLQPFSVLHEKEGEYFTLCYI